MGEYSIEDANRDIFKLEDREAFGCERNDSITRLLEFLVRQHEKSIVELKEINEPIRSKTVHRDVLPDNEQGGEDCPVQAERSTESIS